MRCQSVMQPSTAEYWHIGAMTIRLLRRRSPTSRGSKSFGPVILPSFQCCRCRPCAARYRGAGGRGRAAALPPDPRLLFFLLIERVEDAAGVDERCAGVEGDGNAEGFGDFLAGCALLQRGLAVHGNAAVAAGRDGDGERDQFAGFRIQTAGLGAGAGQRLVAFQRVGAQLAHLTDTAHKFVVIFYPVQHGLSSFMKKCYEFTPKSTREYIPPLLRPKARQRQGGLYGFRRHPEVVNQTSPSASSSSVRASHFSSVSPSSALRRPIWSMRPA